MKKRVDIKKNNIFFELKKKIVKNKIVAGVVGLGYVGLPLSLSFAKKKIKVFGFDNDKSKIQQLKQKKSYILSVDRKSISKYLGKTFFPTHDFKIISKCDVIVICVPTPINKNKKPILKYIIDVVNKIKKYIKPKQILILECTTYPGTTEKYFLPLLKHKKLILGKNFFLGYSPEREDPGNKKYSVIKGNLPKVVSGYSGNCLLLISLFYKKISNQMKLLRDEKNELSNSIINYFESKNANFPTINISDGKLKLIEIYKSLSYDILSLSYGIKIFN